MKGTEKLGSSHEIVSFVVSKVLYLSHLILVVMCRSVRL